MDRAQMMAEGERQQYTRTEASGGPAAAICALDEWGSLTTNSGRSDWHLR